MRTSRIPLRAPALRLTLLTVLLTAFSCRVRAQGLDANAAREAKTYHALEVVPQKARAGSNPLESDPEAVRAGGKLFEEHCADCHGKKAEGGKKGAGLLKPQVAQASPGTLFWILSNGVLWRGMPDWSKLPEPQRWQLVAFLKSLKASAGANTPPQASLAFLSSGATTGKVAMEK
jgi:mono/diheme cytochrome c family protein